MARRSAPLRFPLINVNRASGGASSAVTKKRTPASKRPLPRGDRVEATRFFNEGVKRQKQGNPNEAIALYQKAVTTDLSFTSAYYNLGIAYRALGQPEKALDHYELAIMSNPDFIEGQFNYAILLHEQGYLDDAIAAYEKPLEMNPQDASSHVAVANLYARNPATLGKARKHYRAYLRLAPNSLIARDIRRWLDQTR